VSFLCLSVSHSLLPSSNIAAKSLLLEYAACGTPGDSGSPVWGWWADGPYLTGLMTISEDGAVWGPGGPLIANLISEQN